MDVKICLRASMRLFVTVVFLLGSGVFGATTPTELQRAEKLYQYTDFEGALKVLQGIPDKGATVYHWIGRNYYMLGDFKKSTEYLERALASDPSNSDYALWLGRAYGRRAETSSILTAPGNAGKARQYFERAVQLDGGNREALSDLFEYYIEAPGFLGGGLDKAADVAERITKLDPVEGLWAKSRIAEKRKEFTSAEEHLRRAADLAPQQVGRILDLGKFLAKQGRYQESDQTFADAERIAPNSPKVMFTLASTFVRNGRHLDKARTLLKKYIASDLTPDDPPRTQAEKLLKQAGG